MYTITTKKPEQTQQFAAKILTKLTARPRNGALILALAGDLGAGKTTFVQGLAQELGITEPITSPTFILANTYDISSSDKQRKLTHIDCYRFESAANAEILPFTEMFQDQEHLICIEWPEKIQELLPKDTVWIGFEYGKKENERIIKISHGVILAQAGIQTSFKY